MVRPRSRQTSLPREVFSPEVPDFEWPQWQKSAECRGVGPSIFFEQPGPQAQELCRRCSVSSECRQFANIHATDGFWAGQEYEREPGADYNEPESTQIQAAITRVVAGRSMRQASLSLGFNPSWLSLWRRNHPDRYREIYLEIVEETIDDDKAKDLAIEALNSTRQTATDDQIRSAISQVVAGESMRQASLGLGFHTNWLSEWKHSHPDQYQKISKSIQRDRLNKNGTGHKLR